MHAIALSDYYNRVQLHTNMKHPLMIIAKYVHEYITIDSKGKHLLQIAGVANNKPMKYQVWEIPFDTIKEAEEKKNEYTKMLNENASKTFIVFIKK